MSQVPEILTSAEASKVLRVSRKWLRESPDAPPVMQLGPRKFVYSRAAIEAWLAARTVDPSKRSKEVA
ncbi:helix-turn-helix transcriptional regulator [Microvirga massiliensis]|uniref:helix-turn-helix transcriptional regulator n=1 Tax=Microvirga massiliensis TaxID=1033741 RepID=UPI00062BBAD0|nr:hypothetical protein [Microvirga massiliensis]